MVLTFDLFCYFGAFVLFLMALFNAWGRPWQWGAFAALVLSLIF